MHVVAFGLRRSVALVVAVSVTACYAGENIAPGTATRNTAALSQITARERAGGKNEGPLGFAASVSRSPLYDELVARNIRPETLGPLNQIRDQEALLGVMNTFSRALGVRCSWCHDMRDWAAPTARKAAAAYMWDVFVGQMQLVDGGALYCDSCHHESTIFLHRDVRWKQAVAKYMQTEYVDKLRRRDGGEHGCATCHGKPFNARFLPRIDDPRGWHPPTAEAGPQP
jgi:hypothetical protein